ncbi:MAG: hypothetical protein IJJ26_03820, partial [Victivallales bacterium]|nr:hypothetical protein [Victivallales bacterium]
MRPDMNAAKLRRLYLDFFKKHGHAEIKSAPLVPENDPTCLFTTAGMHPLVPYLLGQKHPMGVIEELAAKAQAADVIDSSLYAE